jgi:molecular chaperone DnaJ
MVWLASASPAARNESAKRRGEPSPEDLFGGIDFDEIFCGRGFGADFGVGWGGGMFERFFGRRAPARGEDIEVMLTIPLEKVATGGEAA